MNESARTHSAASSAGWSLLQAAALGAALMYFLDPRAGKRRRARVRDRLVHLGRLAGRARRVTARDVANRAAGAWAEAVRLLRAWKTQAGDGASADGETAARVRARLGRYVSHPHSVDVAVRDGCATLSGPILRHEAKDLLACVRHVPGVRKVEDALIVYDKAGNIPALQGGLPRAGDRSEFFQENWAPAARMLAGGAGAGLVACGLRSGGPLGLLSALLGGGLLLRAAANRQTGTLLGIGEHARGIEVQKTAHIAAPVHEVFEFWADYGNFPHFMSRVREVRSLEDGRSHWVVSGPGGMPVEWTAELTHFEPNRLIGWRTDPGSGLRHHGIVRFDQEDGGTRIGIRLWYLPPAGVLGHAVASVLGADPRTELDEDLVRMKTLIETGRTPHDAAQPLPRSGKAVSRRADPLDRGWSTADGMAG